MFIPEKMKLNRFKEVSMPTARDYFKLTGFQATPQSSYTGDESAPQPMNKVDSINDFLDYAEMMAREEAIKQTKND